MSFSKKNCVNNKTRSLHLFSKERTEMLARITSIHNLFDDRRASTMVSNKNATKQSDSMHEGPEKLYQETPTADQHFQQTT